MSVKFIEKTHQYFNDSGVEYTSVTKFLHLFQAPFDEMAVSARVAAREGVSQQEILDRWHAISRQACNYGTNIHAKMEHYLKDGTREEGFEALYDSFDSILGDDIVKAQRKGGKVNSEMILWNDEAKLAGTADLIIDLNDEEFLVGDFKTNKSIDFYSKYGDHMLAPISHLTSCNYSIYSLQLSVYAHFYSILTGKKCRNVFLLYKVLNEEGKDIWKPIPANFMKHEVMVLLNYYTNHPELLANGKH